MADTSFGTNNALAVKLFSRKLFTEALKKCWLYKFIGNDDNSMIQILPDTSEGPGDKITFPLRMQLSGAGVAGDNTLEGNEEDLTMYSDSLLIDQLRHAVRSGGKMSEQRVTFSVREGALDGLSDWWADRIDTCGFNQLCGNTGQADLRYAGNNATVAPSSNAIYYANQEAASGPTTEALVNSGSASAVFKITFLDNAVERAKVNSPAIRPIKLMGDNYYVAFLHPYQVTNMRQSTSTGQWLDIQKAAMQGGLITKNPIFTGAMGMYNNVIIHESTRIPRTSNGSDYTATNLMGAYRAVLCGAQAATIAFGQNSAGNKVEWVEEQFDYGNKLGVAAGMVFGIKKTVFNSKDFGTVVIVSFAQAH